MPRTASITSTELTCPLQGRLRLPKNLSSRLDLITLRLFVTIVEERSISRAAKRECIVPSAVSKRIADLEAATHSQLLYRHRTGIEPTLAGVTLLNHARTILRNLAELESDIVDYAQGIRGNVRIFTNESVLLGYFPDALKTFAKRYPEIRIDLLATTSMTSVQSVMDGTADIGVFWGDVPTGTLNVASCRYSDQLVAVVLADHPLAHRTCARYEDILAYELIEQETGSALQTLLSTQAARLGITPRTHMRVSGYDAACRVVQAGLGVAIVPGSYVAAHLFSARNLKNICLQEDWVERHYMACVKALERQSVATRLMYQHLTGSA